MNRLDVRRALNEAIDASDLKPLQKLRLKTAMVLRPFAAQNAHDIVRSNCVAQGMVSEDGEIAHAVDWAAIIALIIELLPVILKLFGL